MTITPRPRIRRLVSAAFSIAAILVSSTGIPRIVHPGSGSTR